MSNNYIELEDTLSPQAGKAVITFGGQNRELFEVVNLRAQLDQNVITKGVMGSRMKKHKRGSAEGTGTATLYFANSQMLAEAQTYLKTGNHVPITVQAYNEDASSSIGRQEVRLYNVIFKTLLLFAIDVDSDDPITFDSDFTYDDFEVLSTFKLPTNFQ